MNATTAHRVRRKRRTREHIIAELSANHFERHALNCGLSVEQVRHDYGVDMFLFFYDSNGGIRNGHVRVQLKATDKPQFRRNKTSLAVNVDARDLRAWLASPEPVILVLYDAPNDRAYWLYVQAHFESLPHFKIRRKRATMIVQVPMANLVDRKAIRRFEMFNDEVLRQQQGRIRHDV